EAGADDYLGYPFNSREAALRIKALARRGKTKGDEEQFSRGPIQLDSTRYCVTIEGRPVRLTAVEFKLLRRLLAQAGRVQSRQALLETARGIEEIVETRTIDT